MFSEINLYSVKKVVSGSKMYKCLLFLISFVEVCTE